MRWKAPSERVQFMLAAPVVIPITVIAAPFVLMLAGLVILDDWLRPSLDWHRWFAWHPVSLSARPTSLGERRAWAWLETVERRSRLYNWPTEYRPIGEAAE